MEEWERIRLCSFLICLECANIVLFYGIVSVTFTTVKYLFVDVKDKIQLQLQRSEGKKRMATYRICVGAGFLQSRTGSVLIKILFM